MSQVRPISVFEDLSIPGADDIEPEAAGTKRNFQFTAFRHGDKKKPYTLTVHSSDIPVSTERVRHHLDKVSASSPRVLSLLGEVIPERTVTVDDIVQIINEESNVAGGARASIQVVVFDADLPAIREGADRDEAETRNSQRRDQRGGKDDVRVGCGCTVS